MAEVIAIHRITVCDPHSDLITTGWDDDGAPIVRKATISHLPGDKFEFNDPIELERLLAMGAVRYPSDTEIAVFERMERQRLAAQGEAGR